VVLVPVHRLRHLSVGEAGALEAVAHGPADLLVGVAAEAELGVAVHAPKIGGTGKFSGSGRSAGVPFFPPMTGFATGGRCARLRSTSIPACNDWASKRPKGTEAARGGLEMASDPTSNPRYWRDLAERARHAAQMADRDSKLIIVGIADAYERLAGQAEQALAQARFPIDR
jgi:hypothetical protein